MAAIELKLASQLAKLQNLADKIGKKETGKAISASINRSLTSSVTLLKRSIRDQYKISTSDLRDFPILRSTPQTQSGNIKVRSSPISLAHFNPRFVSVSNAGNTSISIKSTRTGLRKVVRESKTRKPVKGVSFEIRKNKRMTVPYAFMTKNDSEKPVFARGEYKGGNHNYAFVPRRIRVDKTGPDLPINKLLSTSVSGMVANSIVQRRVSVDAASYFMKRLEHELRYRISRL